VFFLPSPVSNGPSSARWATDPGRWVVKGGAIRPVKRVHRESEPRLGTESEDSLFDVVVDLGNDYFDLFASIHFEYLSSDRVAEFVDQSQKQELGIRSPL
jgi:hypothetical protein